MENGETWKIAPANFRVNGIVGWAAFRLKRGAYEAMEKYAVACHAFVEEKFSQFQESFDASQVHSQSERHEYTLNLPENVPDPYGFGLSFNCMTFALNVYEQGRNPKTILQADCTNQVKELKRQVDHPNAYIKDYMDKADDKGYFDDRKFQGEPEAVSGSKQAKVMSIRHYTDVKLVS